MYPVSIVITRSSPIGWDLQEIGTKCPIAGSETWAILMSNANPVLTGGQQGS
jgi:hypothetical protein